MSEEVQQAATEAETTTTTTTETTTTTTTEATPAADVEPKRKRRLFNLSAHDGASEWLKKHYPAFKKAERTDVPLTDLIGQLEKGDVVIGILPITAAEEVCNRGAKMYVLSADDALLSENEDLQGKSRTLEEMEKVGTTLNRYSVVKHKK